MPWCTLKLMSAIAYMYIRNTEKKYLIKYSQTDQRLHLTCCAHLFTYVNSQTVMFTVRCGTRLSEVIKCCGDLPSSEVCDVTSCACCIFGICH